MTDTVEINERPTSGGVMLEATVKGEKLWRVWREGSVSSLEKKRILLRRDIKLHQQKTNPQ